MLREDTSARQSPRGHVVSRLLIRAAGAKTQETGAAGRLPGVLVPNSTVATASGINNRDAMITTSIKVSHVS